MENGGAAWEKAEDSSGWVNRLLYGLITQGCVFDIKAILGVYVTRKLFYKWCVEAVGFSATGG